VIRSIAVLTVANSAANMELERQIGLVNLEMEILRAQQVPSAQLCDILISMLGPNFTDLAGSPSKAVIGSFCNVTLIPVTLRVAVRCSRALQVKLLSHVHGLVSGPAGLPSLLRAKQLTRPIIDEVQLSRALLFSCYVCVHYVSTAWWCCSQVLDVLPKLEHDAQIVAIRIIPHVIHSFCSARWSSVER